jgi:hypothetical protein
MRTPEQIIGRDRLTQLTFEGYAVVPIQPSEAMLERLSEIGDGPELSGAEVWGYMLACVVSDECPICLGRGYVIQDAEWEPIAVACPRCKKNDPRPA